MENKYTEDQVDKSDFTGSFLEIINDPEARMNWIRPVSYRNSGVAFQIDNEENIICVWPACMLNLKIGFSVVELKEDWELIDPMHVMVEKNQTMPQEEYEAWLKETRMDG